MRGADESPHHRHPRGAGSAVIRALDHAGVRHRRRDGSGSDDTCGLPFEAWWAGVDAAGGARHDQAAGRPVPPRPAAAAARLQQGAAVGPQELQGAKAEDHHHGLPPHLPRRRRDRCQRSPAARGVQAVADLVDVVQRLDLRLQAEITGRTAPSSAFPLCPSRRRAVARFLEFFARRIANERTRAAYAQAVGQRSRRREPRRRPPRVRRRRRRDHHRFEREVPRWPQRATAKLLGSCWTLTPIAAVGLDGLLSNGGTIEHAQ